MEFTDHRFSNHKLRENDLETFFFNIFTVSVPRKLQSDFWDRLYTNNSPREEWTIFKSKGSMQQLNANFEIFSRFRSLARVECVPLSNINVCTKWLRLHLHCCYLSRSNSRWPWTPPRALVTRCLTQQHTLFRHHLILEISELKLFPMSTTDVSYPTYYNFNSTCGTIR